MEKISKKQLNFLEKDSYFTEHNGKAMGCSNVFIGSLRFAQNILFLVSISTFLNSITLCMH
jgi:hypothetical protein